MASKALYTISLGCLVAILSYSMNQSISSIIITSLIAISLLSLFSISRHPSIGAIIWPRHRSCNELASNSQSQGNEYDSLKVSEETSNIRCLVKTSKHDIFSEVRRIVSGKIVEGSRMSFYRSRRLPNLNLANAFGIDNPFTSEDKPYCESFRRRAGQLMSLDQDAWNSFSLAAFKLAQHLVRTSLDGMDDCIRLVPLFQALVFRTVLTVVFPERKVSDLRCDDQPTIAITDAINVLWIASKKLERDPTSSQSDLEDLFKANRSKLWNNIDTMFPESCSKDHQSRENPLNWIVPAYENMWRVVMRCSIEIIYRKGHIRYEWAKPLELLAKRPTRSSFSKVYGTVSAEHIIKEALRLYPPTKSIYRAIPGDTGELETVAANIKQLHRCEMIWGTDAKIFRPERWTEKPHGKCLMAFGCTPHLCPAQNTAPRMIGILVGAIIAELGHNSRFISLGNDNMQDGEPLSLDRDAFRDAKIKLS